VREVARGSLCDVCERMYRRLHSADEGGSDRADGDGVGPMSGEDFEDNVSRSRSYGVRALA
jgi:hypothetical protein